MGIIGMLIGLLVIGGLVWLFLKRRTNNHETSNIGVQAVNNAGVNFSPSKEEMAKKREETHKRGQQRAKRFPDGHWETTGTDGSLRIILWPGDRVERILDGGKPLIDWADGRRRRITGDYPTGSEYKDFLQWFPEEAR